MRPDFSCGHDLRGLIEDVAGTWRGESAQPYSGAMENRQAWVVAVDMGYGHQRAAYPFRDIAYEGVITANTGAMVDPAERKRWTAMQSLHEGIWRVNKVPVAGRRPVAHLRPVPG